MSDFILNYGILETIANDSKSLGKRADEYADNLENKIISGIGTVTGPPSGYLLSASDSVRDKITALKQKSEAFYQFAEQIIKLLEVAEQMDQEVADAITAQRGELEHNKSLGLEDWKAKLIDLLVDIKNGSPLLASIADILGGMAAIHESLNDSIKHWYDCGGGKRAVKGAIGKIETSCNIVGPVALSEDLARQFSRERYEQLRKNLISNSDLSNKKGDVESNGKHGFLDLLKTYYGVLGIASIAPIYIINKEELKLLKRGTLSYSGLNYGKENGNVSLKENILKTYSDFSNNLSDFLTGGAVAVDNNFTFGGVKKLNGYDENQPHSKAYKLGKYTVDAISLAAGAGTTLLGGLMGISGFSLSSTGAGAVAGVPLSAVGAGAITYGGSVIIKSTRGIVDDGRSLMSGDGGSSKADPKSNEIDVDNLPSGWTKVTNNGFTHVRDANGNIRVRIDPPDAKTPYTHKHLYDESGNSLDINGNIVNPKSPDAHMPLK
jgi:hypothetical protein